MLSATILLLCVMGTWLSDGLLQVHDGVPTQATVAGRLIANLCGAHADESSGCQASARSAWSTLRLPIPAHPIELPVAFLGIAYFITLGTWYAFVGEAPIAWKPLRWVPIAIAVVGIYASLFLFSLMALGRVPWCAGCVTVHVINLLLFVSISLSRYITPPPHAAAHRINYRQCAAVLVFAIVLIIVLYSSHDRRLALQAEVAALEPYEKIVDQVQQNPKLMVDAYLSEPKQSIPIRPDEIDPAATHQLVVFLDYQCPACLITAGKLNVIVRQYPLCKACNPRIPRTIHPAACMAADAAEAARLLGGRPAFERMSDLLFAAQPYLTSVLAGDLAKDAGLNPDRFLHALHDPAVQKRIEEDVAEAHALDVTNTPTMFLDDRRVPQISLAPGFWKAAAKLPVSAD
jgi:protein-disulfide isomerase/uncharacterized membrane protein